MENSAKTASSGLKVGFHEIEGRPSQYTPRLARSYIHIPGVDFTLN